MRIEDTDLQRSTEESTRSIIDGLEWLGLDYEEEIVFQSQNADKHRAAAYKLVKESKAYRDFTPREQRDDAIEICSLPPPESVPITDAPPPMNHSRCA